MSSHSAAGEEDIVEHPSTSEGGLYASRVWGYAVLLISTVVLALFLLVAILSRAKLRQRAFNQLLSSIAVAAVLFSVLVRPGTIQDEDPNYEMNHPYCGFFLFLETVEWVFMPLAIWMLSIERLMAKNEPEKYTRRTNKAGRAGLIGFPWIFSVVISVVITVILGSEIVTRYGPYPDDPYFDEMSHFVEINCMVIYSQQMQFAAVIIRFVFYLSAVLALLASSIALVVVHCRHRNVKVYDCDGELLVPTSSVVYCIILNVCAALVLILEWILSGVMVGFMYIHWAWTVVELLAVVFAICLVPEIRKVVGTICCCGCGPNDEKKSLLGEAKETQTSACEKSVDNE